MRAAYGDGGRHLCEIREEAEAGSEGLRSRGRPTISQSPWELQSTDCPSEECHTGQPFTVSRTPTLLGHSKDHGDSMNGAMGTPKVLPYD